MNESGPEFYAWCDEADRYDAFAAALSALTYPSGRCDVSLSTLGTPDDLWRHGVPVDEALAVTRAAFTTGSEVRAQFGARWPWLARTGLSLACWGEAYERRYPHGPLRVGTGERKHVFPARLAIASGVRSTQAEAAISSMEVQLEMAEILLGLCAPDAHARVVTGACTAVWWSWPAPLEACATYHADAWVARDLALSWAHLYDGDIVGRAARLSLDALAARVEAAPKGARVGVATNVERIEEHVLLDIEASRSRTERPTRPDAIRRVPRAVLPGDIELTREQVLRTLSIPPVTLLEALEASAVPDDEWRSAEARARQIINETKGGTPCYEVDVSTGKHLRFIERHAPYHVRRLPSGGVVLATHPYRTLWPLWADALVLLDITS